jgi:RNA polymerase sigma factor (sigma-70 family)
VSEEALVSRLAAARGEFLSLVEAVRPDLHRYCARMTGSIAEGEDVVQETLARAYYAIPELEQLPALRPWLFQIAHNRALDHLRRYDRRMGRPLKAIEETPAEGDPESALSREQVVAVALSRFLELPPAHRSCVILKDVLGHSLEEIGALLGLSVPAVKAALHRGRGRLAELNAAERPAPVTSTPALVRYAALFNAHDWEAVRRMLADDVRLDLVSRVQKAGKVEVGAYFTNYAKASDWRLAPAWLDGREVLAVYRAEGDERPGYFVELSFAGDRITFIRDFRYVPYIAREAAFEGLGGSTSSAGSAP